MPLLRILFLAVYAARFVVFLVRVLPAGLRAPKPEVAPTRTARVLARVLIPFDSLVPPLLLLLRVGEEARFVTVWVSMGALLGLVGVALMLSASTTLGRYFVPEAQVVAGQTLVTRGPYRIVRHPAYAGDLALWLGAALGTSNALLLALWPLAVIGNVLAAREEDRVLRRTFGAEHARYAERTGMLFPRL